MMCIKATTAVAVVPRGFDCVARDRCVVVATREKKKHTHNIYIGIVRFVVVVAVCRCVRARVAFRCKKERDETSGMKETRAAALYVWFHSRLYLLPISPFHSFHCCCCSSVCATFYSMKPRKHTYLHGLKCTTISHTHTHHSVFVHVWVITASFNFFFFLGFVVYGDAKRRTTSTLMYTDECISCHYNIQIHYYIKHWNPIARVSSPLCT